MKASDLIAQVNRERGTSYQIVGRYAQGESRAARRVADAHGNRFVLKFGASTNVKVRDAHPGRTTARLRSLGYPAPEYVAVGIAGETVRSAVGGTTEIFDATPSVNTGGFIVGPSAL